MSRLPKFGSIQRKYLGQSQLDVAELPGILRRQLEPILKRSGSLRAKRIGITAGSRGVSNMALAIQTTVQLLRSLGAEPIIIPAMGSHGGATPEGQLDVLREYGITEEAMGAFIDARMETRHLGQSGAIPIVWGQSAIDCDGIIAINRIKPHTGFVGKVESGLCKMLTIGCGKQQGAERYHRLEKTYGMEHIIRTVSEFVIAKGRILAGIGMVENARHQTARIVALAPELLIRGEELMLEQAKRWMPAPPFAELDALHVCRMGKEISGSGMDSNIIGLGPDGPRRKLLVREGMCKIGLLTVGDLTPETHGNCIGLGFADATTKRLLQAVDWPISQMNAETAGRPDVIEAPPHVFPGDSQLFHWIFKQVGGKPSAARVAIIPDTLYPGNMMVSSALLSECQSHEDVDVLSDSAELSFGEEGRLITPW